MKKQNIYKIIMLVILAVTITFMLTTMIMYNKFSKAYENNYSGINSSSSSDNKGDLTELSLIKTLESFKTMLNQKYIGEIDEEKMLESAIKGYVEGLGDPYTEYLTKEEMSDFMEETNAEYVGIGVYLTENKTDNTILVVGIMKNSPALEAGMQEGDVITKVNDVAYTGENIDEAIKIMKGQEGTNVKVTILRDGKEIELDVQRKKINVEHVASQMLENNIAYITRTRIGYEDKILVKILKSNEKYSIVTNYSTEELTEMGYTSSEIRSMPNIAIYDEILINK